MIRHDMMTYRGPHYFVDSNQIAVVLQAYHGTSISDQRPAALFACPAGGSSAAVMTARMLNNYLEWARNAVRVERARQLNALGFNRARDEGYTEGELMAAAICYSKAVGPGLPQPDEWPWASAWWKPRSRKRNLEKAGALAMAEYDRLTLSDLSGYAIPLRRLDEIIVDLASLQMQSAALRGRTETVPGL